MIDGLFTRMSNAAKRFAESFRPEPEDTDLIAIRNNTCPVCHTVGKFREGPSGGFSVNYQCQCGQWFNVGFGIGSGPIFVERIDKK